MTSNKERKIINTIYNLSFFIAPLAFIGFFYFFVFFLTIPQTYLNLYIFFLEYGKMKSLFLSLICGTAIISFFCGILGSLSWVGSKKDDFDFLFKVVMLGGTEIIIILMIFVII